MISDVNKFFPVHNLFTCKIIQKFDVDINDFLCSIDKYPTDNTISVVHFKSRK